MLQAMFEVIKALAYNEANKFVTWTVKGTTVDGTCARRSCRIDMSESMKIPILFTSLAASSTQCTMMWLGGHQGKSVDASI